MPEDVVVEVAVTQAAVEVLDTGTVVEVILPASDTVEVQVPGPQGPANTDYQIGGSEPTDPNIKIWYKLT